MRYASHILLISLFAVSNPANAADHCQPAFAVDHQTLTIHASEIEAGGRATQDFRVRIQDVGGSSEQSDDMICRAAIRLARMNAALEPEFPPYLVYTQGNSRLEILSDAASGSTASSDVIIADAPPAPQDLSIPFQIAVPTEWGLKAGTYSEQLQMLLVDENGNVADRSTLTVTIVIPPAVSLRLVGAVVGASGRGSAQIDLGTLSSSRETFSQRFGARIFSTAPYLVRFDSANLGQLLHEHGRQQIPYRLFFDGVSVDLAKGSVIPFPDRTPATGDSRPMRIVVPPVTALAGRYSDRITLSITAM